jgi:hypothetical protein
MSSHQGPRIVFRRPVRPDTRPILRATATYSAAAAFTLIAFFPQYAEDLLRLADDAEQQQLKEAFLQEHGLAPEPAG